MSDHPSKQVAIAANPYSGRGRNRRQIDALVEVLTGGGYEPVLMWEKDALAEAAAEPGFDQRYRCVIAAGGDGTLAHVVNQRPQAPVVMYPMGNENLFARQFGYRADPQHTVDLITRHTIRRIDLGSANDQLFTIVASAGFDGRVAHQLAAWRDRRDHLRRVSRSTYLRPILHTAMTYDYPEMTVTADGQTHTGCLVMVFNLSQYGLNLPLAPDADPTDGQLDYIIFQRPGTIRLIGYALAVLLRRHARCRSVITGKARRITIDGPQQVPVETDGEAADFTPLDIRVQPAALPILVPEP